jgi:hypothetical protein
MNKFFIAFTFLLISANFPLLAMESKSNTSGLTLKSAHEMLTRLQFSHPARDLELIIERDIEYFKKRLKKDTILTSKEIKKISYFFDIETDSEIHLNPAQRKCLEACRKKKEDLINNTPPHANL